MCQEIHISDVRLAMLDYCREEDEHLDVYDLLGRLHEPLDDDDGAAHARDHARRAKNLDARGDGHAASIHKALLANMKRAVG